MSQDVEITVIRTHFEERSIWTIPAVDYLLDHVVMSVKSKANRPLIRLSARIALYPQRHLTLLKS